MRNYKKALFLILVAFSVAAAALILRTEPLNAAPQDKQKKFDKAEYESQFPVVDYDAPEPADPAERAKRRAKSKKYDKADFRITERADTVMSYVDWEADLPALPVTQSRAVIIGDVTKAQAHLSNDKTSIYSEFTIHISEVLKNDGDDSMTAGGSVVAERSGGRVKFPSGHITLQVTRGQGMPRQGKRYVLFLARNEHSENYLVITGYELRAGSVFPMDNPGGDTNPMAAYRGADESLLLKDIRAALESPLN